MRLTFKSVNLGSARCFSIMWVGLIQSVESLNRTKRVASPARGNSPANCWGIITAPQPVLGLQPPSPAGFSQMALGVKDLPDNTGDVRDEGSVPGLQRSPAGGHSNPLQYSCLENPMDRGAWWVTVHGVANSPT